MSRVLRRRAKDRLGELTSADEFMLLLGPHPRVGPLPPLEIARLEQTYWRHRDEFIERNGRDVMPLSWAAHMFDASLKEDVPRGNTGVTP